MADMLYGLEGLNLTPQEINKVLYHRKNLGNPLMTKNGPVTIYATGIQVPDGPYKGQFASIPGYADGKLLEDTDSLWARWKDEINAGKWPLYPSSKALNTRDEWLHQIMEKDMDKFFPQKDEEMDNPFYFDPFSLTIK